MPSDKNVDPFADRQLKAARNHNDLFMKVTDDSFQRNYEVVRENTMLSVERLYDLSLACRYVNQAGIPGAVAEIGTWRGGALGIAVLENLANGRLILGFDTFEGHYLPAEDEIDIRGHSMRERYLQTHAAGEGFASASLDECRAFLDSLGKPADEIVLVKGDIRETLGDWTQTPISILRVDCDWYAESLLTLELVWPTLSDGGIAIFDDYGHIPGQKRAVDEFFGDTPMRMTHVDYSCVVVQKRDH